MVTIADSYEIHKKGVYEMKDKKTNVWVPVAVIIGILLVAMIVLTVFMVVTGRSAGNTGSSSSKYHADSTQSDVKPQDSDDYIQDVSLDEFSIGGSSDDSSASDNAEAAEVAMEDPNGYILPDSDSRKLKKSDLAGMTAQQLSYAKNEIYARHGRVFKSSELQDYFNEKNWYEENDDFKDEDLSKKEAENTKFIAGDVEKVLDDLIKKQEIIPDVVMIDPPRKGLDKKSIQNLLDVNPKRLVYISCNPSTLVRDLAFFEEKYEIKNITPVDMFPYTSHVECVAVMCIR